MAGEIELTKRSEARRQAGIDWEPSELPHIPEFPHSREEIIQFEEGSEVWRVHPAVQSSLDQLASLATDLLPDFVDGPIFAEVIEPRHWGISPRSASTMAITLTVLKSMWLAMVQHGGRARRRK